MENIVKELGIPSANIISSSSNNLFTTVVHDAWLKRWLKNKEINSNINHVNFTFQIFENVPYPWKKIFIRVLNKQVRKVLPLPRCKISESNIESSLTFSQLLQYVSQTNQRNLWRESYKKYNQNSNSNKETTVVNLLEHDQLVTEVILRVYGCNIIRIKSDGSGKIIEYKEILPNKYVSKSYEAHPNLAAALFVLETDSNFFIIYNTHYTNNLLDCLNFSPSLINKNISRGLFIIYQLLHASKSLNDRGLSLGNLLLHDIYLKENLWLQILPTMINNIYPIDASIIYEQTRSKQGSFVDSMQNITHVKKESKEQEWCWRQEAVQLEKLCMLWINGKISNLDYLLYLNAMAGRHARDPQTHYVVPWVTDFSLRCGKNWRDLTKSKYRLTKGDRQLDMTYETAGRDGIPANQYPEHIPHHVPDALSDITYYVYKARRTPKDILCKHVRNKWVPAEYPASILRMQEWTPDECIPEFYTDPMIFKSIHEDLPDLGIPSWATCVEDFIMKHREALESTHVSENLHHWIDLTFGYKLSGVASVKAKNVCLSLVDGHTRVRRGSAVQLFCAPHPACVTRPLPSAPPRLHWTIAREKKPLRSNESSEDISDEDDSSLPQHVSRLSVCSHHRSHHKSHRARSLSKGLASDADSSSRSSEGRSSTRHYRVQKSELGRDIIYLPKEYNPVAAIQALESIDNFKAKCFFSKSDVSYKSEEAKYSCQIQDVKKTTRDENSFTNHMFLATYDQNYLKRFNQDNLERRNRSFNTRYTTNAAVYKQFVTESRHNDTLVIGCLIVEIFLFSYIRPVRTGSETLIDRCNYCRTVFKNNYNSLPKCVSYIAALLLNLQPLQENPISREGDDISTIKTVTDKGLPPPTASQLLQPLLMQHLLPFPRTFNILYKLLETLHEYELTSKELNILCLYECDGLQCFKYQNVDKTKLHFSQKIAEGKVQACAMHLDNLLKQLHCYNQFDVLDLFLPHYIELLANEDTSVLAAWYLFDTVSKSLGPVETRKKLLKHILNLYDEDDLVKEHHSQNSDTRNAINLAAKQKFVKLYHNIFLLQLMVRLGLQCFLEYFTQHLVEAVGGYKDCSEIPGSPGHLCQNRLLNNKKPRYSDETVKNAFSASDVLSPDTSFGSESVVTPNVDGTITEGTKDTDSRSEEVFHFESDRQETSSIRSKSPDNLIQQSPSQNIDLDRHEFYFDKEFVPEVKINAEDDKGSNEKGPTSPIIQIPSKDTMFTSYLHFAEENTSVEDEDRNWESRKSRSFNEDDMTGSSEVDNRNLCKISDISSESLIWLSYRLGPVLTCRYVARNLLKMLTLCYIGKDNLVPIDDSDCDADVFHTISIANSRVLGDKNAMKVIKCLTTIIAMYGEQLIMFQYLPHMGDLIASCRRRLSAPLEGGVIACLQLLKYLIPFMSDAKVMEQLQETILKCILHPTLRLLSTTRCSFPSGVEARMALAHKFLDALYVIAVRIGPEMTRKHLCVPALQRFFLAFDKASGKTDNWLKRDSETSSEVNKSIGTELDKETGQTKVEGFLEICRDGSTAEWTVRDGLVIREDAPPDIACSPPEPPPADCNRLSAQEELLLVFNEELAHQAFVPFVTFVGIDTLERSLKNLGTVQMLCQSYKRSHATSPACNMKSRYYKEVKASFSDEGLSQQHNSTGPSNIQAVLRADFGVEQSTSNSFGSNVTVIGNRIDVATADPEDCSSSFHNKALGVVSNKMENGIRNERHLRGDWLIYWEHEIGRPDKENRFNLKQIKLQQFTGHTQAVKSIYCLDNENSFMSGSKDKTVKLWSLRNQGDGGAVTQCNWTYTGHKKGVLSLSFLESLRLTVSTDSSVHIWDPFMESLVSQLDNIKVPISIVRSMPGPSTVVVAATTDGTLKMIDARCCTHTHDLKVALSQNTFIRCMCISPSGRWIACGLASGQVAIVEASTGLPLASWRAHDGEVLQLAPAGENAILSSGLDQSLALWSVADGELICHLKGSTEPVHCLSVYYNELISGTTNNRIGVHTALSPDSSFSSTKLRSDTFKGVLTSMAVLPLNRLLLLGSDNGNISLLC